MDKYDKLEGAAKHFLIAAALFEQIKVELPNLNETERTLDFTETNLEMCSYITKAQAQCCAFEKVKQTQPINAIMLAQLAMQTSDYYKKAYEQALVLAEVKEVNLKTFTSVLNHNLYYFMAQANHWMSQHYIMNMKKEAVNIVKAIGYSKEAYEALNRSNASSMINPQYEVLKKKYLDQYKQLVNANNKVYHQAAVESVNKIECLQYSQAFSLQEELNRPFEGREIFAKMIPPEVQRLEDEYRRYIQDLIGIAQQWICIADREYDGFMKSHNLPESLYATPVEQKLPKDLLTKVQECKERGGVKLLRYSFEEMVSAITSTELRLDSLQSQLECEAKDDEEFRKKYGAKCEKSSKLNEEMWRSLVNFGNRLTSVKNIVNQIRRVVEDEKLEAIKLDKEEVLGRLPQSNCIEKELTSIVKQ